MSNTQNKNDTCPIKKTSIGGQALIEGIMMKGPKKISMAVRNPEGEMVIENWDVDNSKKSKLFTLPFLRGVFGFIDSMKFGYKCLMRSAEIAGLEDTPPAKVKGDEAADANQNVPRNFDTDVSNCDANVEDSNNKQDPKSSEIQPWVMSLIMVIASVLGVALALLLFKALPETLFELFVKLIPALGGSGYGYSLIRAAFVGVIKIGILVAYMSLVSLMKEIKRTFMYHGAEHKSIMCYEKGLELTVENVRMQKRFHPRCGTSFLVLMVLVGIFITMFIPAELSANGTINVILRTLISLALLPVMMSIGYELIKIAGKYDNRLTRIISAPGLWLQRITTREPEDDMIECAITALKNVIPEDGSDDWNNK